MLPACLSHIDYLFGYVFFQPELRQLPDIPDQSDKILRVVDLQIGIIGI